MAVVLELMVAGMATAKRGKATDIAKGIFVAVTICRTPAQPVHDASSSNVEGALEVRAKRSRPGCRSAC